MPPNQQSSGAKHAAAVISWNGSAALGAVLNEPTTLPSRNRHSAVPAASRLRGGDGVEIVQNSRALAIAIRVVRAGPPQTVESWCHSTPS